MRYYAKNALEGLKQSHEAFQDKDRVTRAEYAHIERLAEAVAANAAENIIYYAEYGLENGRADYVGPWAHLAGINVTAQVIGKSYFFSVRWDSLALANEYLIPEWGYMLYTKGKESAVFLMEVT